MAYCTVYSRYYHCHSFCCDAKMIKFIVALVVNWLCHLVSCASHSDILSNVCMQHILCAHSCTLYVSLLFRCCRFYLVVCLLGLQAKFNDD